MAHAAATVGRLSVVFAATVALLPFSSGPARVLAYREVTVTDGDTLTAIALAYLGDPAYAQWIAEYNQLTDPDHLVAGQVLKLPDLGPEDASVLSPPPQPAGTQDAEAAGVLKPPLQPPDVQDATEDRVEPLTGPVIETGLATWYGPGFEGNLTKCGQIFHETGLTASSNDLPCGTVIQVTNVDNGRQVIVTVDDTGGFRYPNILDLSAAAFAALDAAERGVIQISVAPVQEE